MTEDEITARWEAIDEIGYVWSERTEMLRVALAFGVILGIGLASLIAWAVTR